jgi:hypothetical protein
VIGWLVSAPAASIDLGAIMRMMMAEFAFEGRRGSGSYIAGQNPCLPATIIFTGRVVSSAQAKDEAKIGMQQIM